MKHYFSLLAYTIIILSISGCIQKQPRIVHLTKTLTSDDVQKIVNATGKNVIKGSALMRQHGGGVVTCAGYGVKLIPATEYAKERMSHIYGSTQRGVFTVNMQPINFEPELHEYRQMEKNTLCDAQGYFKFENVPDGEYFVVAMVVWGVPMSASYSEAQGGALMQAVSVSGGETKELVLAP